MYLDAGINSI